MKPSSSKAKGRILQNQVRDKILDVFPHFESNTDIRSAIMGETGEDIKLSKKARKYFPFSVECKSLASVAVYRHMEQAQSNCPKGAAPLVVIKENRKKPLAILDFNIFMELVSDFQNEKNKNT
tara:strand:- start:635 stop:1003 length:369 start_codon:yes stop_codon:yes gene_type:complete